MSDSTPGRLRVEISDLCGDYQQIIKQLSRPNPPPQANNLQLLEEKVNSVIKRASEFVKPQQFADNSTQKRAEQLILELSSIKSQIDKITEETRQKTESFNTTMSLNEQQFEQHVKQVVEDFNSNKDALTKAHEARQSALQLKIDELNKSFEQRLQQGVGAVIKEKERLSAELAALRKTYQDTKAELESQLAATDKNVESLTESLTEMEKKNSKAISDLETEYQSKIAKAKKESANKIEKLQGEYDEVSKKAKAEEEEMASKLTSMKSDLEKLNTEHMSQIQAQIAVKQSQLDFQLKTIEDANAKTIASLNEKFQKEEADRKAKKASLEAQVSELTAELQKLEKSTSEKISAAKTKGDLLIKQKEDELKRLTDDQKRAIDSTKAANETELTALRGRMRNTQAELEQSLIETANQAEAEKRKLESDVQSLIKAKNAMESDLQKKKMLSTSSDVVFSLKPGPHAEVLARQATIEEMSAKFAKFDSTSSQKVAEIKETKEKKEADLKEERNRARNFVNQEKLKINAFKESIKAQRDQLSGLQTELKKVEEGSRAEAKEKTAELRSKLQLQQNSIRSLREELQRAKIEENQTVQLGLIQSEHREKMRQIQDAIERLNEGIPGEIAALTAKMEDEIEKEKEKSVGIISDAQSKLDGALSDLAAVKARSEAEAMKDYQKWMELRKDIYESNLKIAANIQNSRPTSKVTSRTQALPPLRKA